MCSWEFVIYLWFFLAIKPFFERSFFDQMCVEFGIDFFVGLFAERTFSTCYIGVN